MKPNEREFYERLNAVEDDNDYSWLVAHCICAISGGVMGFLIGFFVGKL